MVWNDLKTYLANIAEPKSEQQLVNGIKKFWKDMVTIDYCNKKIDHVVDKVIDKFIEIHGEPSAL